MDKIAAAEACMIATCAHLVTGYRDQNFDMFLSVLAEVLPACEYGSKATEVLRAAAWRLVDARHRRTRDTALFEVSMAYANHAREVAADRLDTFRKAGQGAV